MDGIFISYRRDDSAGYAGRLYDRLVAHFGAEDVFMDVEGIEPGLDFVEAIEAAVSSCRVLIVIIGDEWTHGTDAAGRRRLDDPHDFIRLETGTALKRAIRVVPVLVGGAVMPLADELPEDLKPLTRRQAIEISHKQWDASSGELIRTLESILNAPQGRQAGATQGERTAVPATEPKRPGGARPAPDRMANAPAAPLASPPPGGARGASRWLMPAALAGAVAAGAGTWWGLASGPASDSPELAQADQPQVAVPLPAETTPATTTTLVATPTAPVPSTGSASHAPSESALAPAALPRPTAPDPASAPAPAPVPAPAPSPIPAPLVRSFTAEVGADQARLCYRVSHAEHLTLSPRPGELASALQDCVTVAIQKAEVFTLTARSGTQIARKTLKVTPLVVAAPPAPEVVRAPAPAPVAVPVPAPAPAPAAATRLPQKGEKWVYRSSGKWGNSPRRVFEIVARSVDGPAVTEGLNVIEPAGGGEETRRTPGDQPYFVTWGSIGFEFSPYFGAFLDLGQQGTLKGFPTPNLEPRWSQWYSEARVLGQESVTVPAGTFNAFKVEVWSSRSPTSSGIFGSQRGAFSSGGDRMEPVRVHYLIWYAPGVKRYVRMQRRVISATSSENDKDLFELMSHGPP